MTYRIAIVSKICYYISGFKIALKAYNDIEFVAEAREILALYALLDSKKIDVIILTIDLDDKATLHDLLKIRQEFKLIKILVCLIGHQDTNVILLNELKANGFILSNDDSEEIYDSIVTCMKSDYQLKNIISQN